MKQIIYIVVAVIVLIFVSLVVLFNLPFEITRKSDIKFGNELVQRIESYKNEYFQLPLNDDWELFEQLGFRIEMLGTVPSYSKINDDEYELIYPEGFDGPYLIYNSKEKRWKIDFPKPWAKQRNKYEEIQFIIEKSGFIELPLAFDANIEYSLKTNYLVNRKGNDTLLFEREIYEIVGFLPDTTNYYAFLHYTVADRLFPTIVTMDKSWQKIDEKIISTQGCLTSPLVVVESCYDSVWIYKDLKIKSISKLVGTIEMETDTTSIVSNIVNMKIFEGFIDKYGKISIKYK